MKRLYGPAPSFEAHVISQFLEQAGIRISMSGDMLTGGRGGLPVQDQTILWVVNDEDYDEARKLIIEHQTNT